MADYDDAERHAIQEVEPKDRLRWLLEEVDEDLTFFGWQQTQVAPPPGVPQLRCDCAVWMVAGLRSRGGTSLTAWDRPDKRNSGKDDDAAPEISCEPKPSLPLPHARSDQP